MKKSRALLSVVALGVGLVGSAQVGCSHSQHDRLERSIEVLISGKLGADYKLADEQLTAAEVDASGWWRIELGASEADLTRRLASIGFEEASDSEQKYYRHLVPRNLSTNGIGEYKVFRAELVLGGGTICERLPCNVDLVVSADSRQVFVSISKV